MRRLVPAVALALLTAACGGSSDSGPFGEGAFAILATSDVGVGADRVLAAVTAPDGDRLASPDVAVTLRTYPDGDETAVQTVPGTFLWAIPDVSGLYRATFTFDRPGVWWVEVDPEGGDPLEPVPMNVFADPRAPGVGDRAPMSESATLADTPLDVITSDPEPEPAFYEMTIADAVTSGRPSVIVFATPQFCQTAICGPTLERIRDMAPDFPDVDFVHVEVFDLELANGDPPELVPVPAVVEWGLPTEPWIFVVDRDGIVVGRFEGLVTADEIAATLG